MTREQVIDEIANDRVRFVTELGYDAANKSVAPAVPLQIDRPVKIARAMDFRPAVRTSRLFRPDFDEVKFLLQFRIAHDLAAQRSAPGRDHLDHRLHSVFRFNTNAAYCNFSLTIRQTRETTLKQDHRLNF